MYTMSALQRQSVNQLELLWSNISLMQQCNGLVEYNDLPVPNTRLAIMGQLDYYFQIAYTNIHYVQSRDTDGY